MHHVWCEMETVTNVQPQSHSPLANRLEKSVSVRLKRASPPLLSQDSRFLAARSLNELTTLLLSSKLLFFCRNPKWLQEEEESMEWWHLPYMLRAFFPSTLSTNKSTLSFLTFIPCISVDLHCTCSLCVCVCVSMRKGSHPCTGSRIYGRRAPWEVVHPVTSAPNSSQAKKKKKHIAMSCGGYKFLLKLFRWAGNITSIVR